MNDSFEKKVRAAAVATWWVLLIGYALLTLTWGVYLVLITARPAWLLPMWGQEVSWDLMQTVKRSAEMMPVRNDARGRNQLVTNNCCHGNSVKAARIVCCVWRKEQPSRRSRTGLRPRQNSGAWHSGQKYVARFEGESRIDRIVVPH